MSGRQTVRQGRRRVGGTAAMVSRETFGFSDAGSGNDKTEFEFRAETIDLSSDGRFETVASLDIADGVGVLFGRGMSDNPLQAQGFTGLRLADDSTPSNVARGAFRVAVRTAQGRRKYNAHEGDLDTEDLYDESDSLLDRRNRTTFPQTLPQFETEPEEITIDVDVTSDITVAHPSTSEYSNMKMEGFIAEALE